jgi:hypothetical protein
LSQTSSKKSRLLFFIQSINTKSYFSFKVGIISRAFQSNVFIILSTQHALKLFIAWLRELGENSIVVIFHQVFNNSKAKFIVENQLAVHISNIFFVHFNFILFLIRSAFSKLIFGILFSIQ